LSLVPSVKEAIVEKPTETPTIRHFEPVETIEEWSFYSSTGALTNREIAIFETVALDFVAENWPLNPKRATIITNLEVKKQSEQSIQMLRKSQRNGRLITLETLISGFVTPDSGGAYNFGNTVKDIFNKYKLVLEGDLESREIDVAFL